MSENKPSICFVAHNAYGALSGEDTGHIGGIERQQAMMALWLAQKGYQVSMVTWEEEGGNQALVRGVRVFTICKRNSGIKFLKFFYPRWYSLNRAMKNADADIYYYNCGDLGLGQVAMWARRNNKKSFYSVASEIDCDYAIKKQDAVRERLLYTYGVKHVDHIVVQTRAQNRLLQNTYQRSGVHIPMPCAGFTVPDTWLETKLASLSKPRVIWVGRFSNEKRLEWLLAVAEKLPNVYFDILGSANFDTEYARNLHEWADRLDNVIIHGRVQHDRIGEFYKNASILCCTSVFEGFPNVFLEAWSVGVPVITSFDPDDTVQTNQLGGYVDSEQALETAIRELTEDKERYTKAAKNVYDFFHKFHTIDYGMQLFADEFSKLTSE